MSLNSMLLNVSYLYDSSDDILSEKEDFIYTLIIHMIGNIHDKARLQELADTLSKRIDDITSKRIKISCIKIISLIKKNNLIAFKEAI